MRALFLFGCSTTGIDSLLGKKKARSNLGRINSLTYRKYDSISEIPARLASTHCSTLRFHFLMFPVQPTFSYSPFRISQILFSHDGSSTKLLIGLEIFNPDASLQIANCSLLQFLLLFGLKVTAFVLFAGHMVITLNFFSQYLN